VAGYDNRQLVHLLRRTACTEDGLENLPEQPPSQGERDPQSGSETWF
jgi:hypothetical protein